MRVLVACERSNTVRDAFLARGHDAYSCDLEKADHPNLNWRRHIRGDARPLLKEPWDLVIAHPPCTYLSLVSACNWKAGLPGSQQTNASMIEEAARFFRECLDANAARVCVENPRQHAYAKELIGVGHDQEIEPWWFGHPYKKATRLWLRGLPPLEPTNQVEPRLSWVDGGGSSKGGVIRGHRRVELRNKTFDGVARAMAEQWG